MNLLGYREDNDGESLLLYEGSDEKFFVKYKGELIEIEEKYTIVPDGTYNQPVDDVPYIVLDNDIYEIASFTDVYNYEDDGFY